MYVRWVCHLHATYSSTQHNTARHGAYPQPPQTPLPLLLLLALSYIGQDRVIRVCIVQVHYLGS